MGRHGPGVASITELKRNGASLGTVLEVLAQAAARCRGCVNAGNARQPAAPQA